MKLYLVETRDEVFVSQRKLDAVYKHVEYEYGKARYRETDLKSFNTSKKVTWIGEDDG